MEILTFQVKLRLLVAATIAVILMSVVGYALAGPVDPYEPVTLLRSNSSILATFGVAVLGGLVAVMGVLVVGKPLPGVGVLIAGVGFAALALRPSMAGPGAGTVRSLIWLHSPDEMSTLYLILATETLLWGLVLAVAVAAERIVRRLRDTAAAIPDGPPQPQPKNNPPPQRQNPDQWLSRAGVLVLTTLFAGVLLQAAAQTMNARQLFFVAAGALYVGALVAHQFFPVEQVGWNYWAAILLAVICCLLAANGKVTAIPGMPPLRMARVMPIDLAGFGVVGAILGHWTSRSIHHWRQASVT